MIRHIVLFYLKNPADAQEAAARLRSMEGKIEGMVSMEVGADENAQGRNAHVALSTLFETRAALENYRTHPVHVPVQKFMHEVMERSSAADYDV